MGIKLFLLVEHRLVSIPNYYSFISSCYSERFVQGELDLLFITPYPHQIVFPVIESFKVRVDEHFAAAGPRAVHTV